MAYTKKEDSAKKTEVKKDHITVDEVEITRAKVINEKLVAFDMIVRGIKIYGNFIRVYTNSEGQEGKLISLPSRPGDQGKYYDIVFFPITKDLKDGIIRKVESLIE